MDWRSRAAYFLTVNTFPINNFYRSALHGSTNFSALLCYIPLCCRFPYSGNRREVRTWIWTLSCCQSLRALLQAVSSACWLANDSGNLSLWKKAEIKKTQRMAVRCVFFLFWFFKSHGFKQPSYCHAFTIPHSKDYFKYIPEIVFQYLCTHMYCHFDHPTRRQHLVISSEGA